MCAVCFCTAQVIPTMAMAGRAYVAKRRNAAELDAILDEGVELELDVDGDVEAADEQPVTAGR